jgi:hypothetical protein
MRRILWCFVTYSQRISVEAERQRLSAIDSNDHLQNILQSECAEEAERINNADRATYEKDCRAAASAVRKVALAASRLADPTGLNMLRAPSGTDLDNFERPRTVHPYDACFIWKRLSVDTTSSQHERS